MNYQIYIDDSDDFLKRNRDNVKKGCMIKKKIKEVILTRRFYEQTLEGRWLKDGSEHI